MGGWYCPHKKCELFRLLVEGKKISESISYYRTRSVIAGFIIFAPTALQSGKARVIMNELVRVSYESNQPTVSGRDLHEALGISTRYNDWLQISSAEDMLHGEIGPPFTDF